ncbi:MULTISPECIES: hypothetical protein [Lactococcus]|uniref:Lipoprotein n=1 Tax=Lactococcus petauri TaxID=1940789 RepID=A0AAJ2MLV2_9LACT|nr:MULTISPECIES: hypothetical protein [Lactococcus]MCH1713377.1 hypothetical protein [Lactococcus petauri]MDT2526913.1 hypothetical protein [Lactococcus petauri]MDT2541457.1 hypothetical protein [Lactococcus petauri]MDT2558055.1 hypothetical protein [Lactococcus petauri]MDT2560186.1 hypothetical protein [Lactococcus petauri]
MTKKLFVLTSILSLTMGTVLVGCASGDSKTTDTSKEKTNQSKENISSFNFISNKNQPETVKDFLPLFAQQLKKYNQVAEKIWPKNAVTGIPVVLEDTESKKMWKINPDGQISDFSEKEAKELNVERSEAPGTWGYYGKQFDKFGVDAQYSLDGKTLEGGGMYFSLDSAALKNKEMWNRYPHLGSYDALVFVLHENFHIFEQTKWNKLSETEIAKIGSEKDQHLGQTEARILRYQLIQNLMKAVTHPKDKTLVLQAIATYNEYKTKHKTDFDNAHYWDRTEGSAQYMEIMTALYTYFPDQLSTDKDITHAIQTLGKQTKGYGSSTGNVEESYDIGAFAGLLLDNYDSSWKMKLMKDKDTTPMSLLADYFQNEKLPAYTPLNEEDKNKLLEKITDKKKELVTYHKQSLEEMKKELHAASDPQQKEALEKEIKALEAKIAALEK